MHILLLLSASLRWQLHILDKDPIGFPIDMLPWKPFVFRALCMLSWCLCAMDNYGSRSGTCDIGVLVFLDNHRESTE
jgi:hypothetical protein